MAEVIVQEKQNGKSSRRREFIRVDMTPMVDLGFLLITFFMMTASFTKPNVMDLGLPAKDPTHKIDPTVIKDKNQITFIIGKNNRVFYHQSNANELNTTNLKETDFDGTQISKIISEAYNNAPEQKIFTVIVKPTDESNYKNFVDMLDNIALSQKEPYGVSDIKPWEKKIYQELTK
ncbi:biopolymer transporter ExbD [Chryseobacterium sp.]|uniref:ExbD/TolR family protein n=1 Tax=Chryseobacterium sp. TaxID=1871047 RepID=UPI0025BDC7BA|nr:biopolymer transporter ExbD [Chryseobacterium sp.]